jgi:replicative DNA helicase Mcm
MADAQQIYAQLADKIERFYQTYHTDTVKQLRMDSGSPITDLWVDWDDIHTWNRDVADDVLKAYPEFKDAFERVLFDLDSRTNDGDPEPLVTVRVYNLPDDRSYDVGETRSEDFEKSIIGVSGQIAKLTDSRTKFDSAVYRCARCGADTEVPQSENGHQEPHSCQSCERQGPFKLKVELSDTYDQRLLQIRVPPEQTDDSDAATMTAVVTGSLEGWLSERQLTAGARVTINGSLELDQSTESDNWGAFDSFLDAESIEIEEQDYEEINVEEYRDEIQELADDPELYDKLVDSLAPNITGGEKIRLIKLAIMLQMFGGYRREQPDGSWVRGDSHIALIGDPATGKSSLFDAVEKIAPRVARASGKGSSAAGLTASVVPDNDFGDGQLTLEAGALALADKGVACIDEIDKMHEESLDSIHSALEQQRVHVHKGGINATIPTRTAMLAAGNPKYGRFDPHEEVHEQHNLDPALFSRFDLQFALHDRPDEDRDREITERKLESWQESALIDQNELAEEDADASAPEIPLDTLRAYIAYARQNHHPVMTDEAGEQIEEYYLGIRSQWNGGNDSIPVTPRIMDGLRRLSEASARARLSDKVTTEDVNRVKQIMGQSLADFGMNEDGEFDADIVETGQSKPQRDRVKNLKSIVNELNDEFDDGVPVDEVVARAEEVGMDAEKAEHEIEKLKEKGELYQPHTDTVRTI